MPKSEAIHYRQLLFEDTRHLTTRLLHGTVVSGSMYSNLFTVFRRLMTPCIFTTSGMPKHKPQIEGLFLNVLHILGKGRVQKKNGKLSNFCG